MFKRCLTVTIDQIDTIHHEVTSGGATSVAQYHGDARLKPHLQHMLNNDVSHFATTQRLSHVSPTHEAEHKGTLIISYFCFLTLTYSVVIIFDCKLDTFQQNRWRNAIALHTDPFNTISM